MKGNLESINLHKGVHTGRVMSATICKVTQSQLFSEKVRTYKSRPGTGANCQFPEWVCLYNDRSHAQVFAPVGNRTRTELYVLYFHLYKFYIFTFKQYPKEISNIV